MQRLHPHTYTHKCNSTTANLKKNTFTEKKQ